MKLLRKAAPLALVLAALLVAPWSANAFGLSGIGARVGDVDPDGAGNALMVGGHLEFEESATRFHLQPGLMYWSADGVNDVNPNFDVMYHFSPASSVGPYLGAGAGMHFYSYDRSDFNNTDVGANLFGGVVFPAASQRWFIEGRYVATDRSQTMISGGVTLPLGH